MPAVTTARPSLVPLTDEVMQGLRARAFPAFQLPTQPPTIGDLEAELGAAQRALATAQTTRQLRALDPRQALYEGAERLSYETGLRSSPTYAEFLRRMEQEVAPQRAHELERFRLQYGLPAETRASIAALQEQTKRDLEVLRGQSRTDAERIRGQLALLARAIAAQAMRESARTRGAASIAGNAAAVSPSRLPEVQRWFEQMAGSPDDGGAIPFSELHAFAQDTGGDVYSLVLEAIEQGHQIDFSR